MNKITWYKSSEIFNREEQLAKRQDFILYGVIEKNNPEHRTLRIRLCDKDKRFGALWFSTTSDCDWEGLSAVVGGLMKFTAKIETFFGNDNLMHTKITIKDGTIADPVEDLPPLKLEDVSLISSLETDQKGLHLMGFSKTRDDGSENYHIRWFNKQEIQLESLKADVTFKIRLSKHQINSDGIRMTGIEHVEYEKDNQIVRADVPVYKICLEVDTITWK